MTLQLLHSTFTIFSLISPFSHWPLIQLSNVVAMVLIIATSHTLPSSMFTTIQAPLYFINNFNELGPPIVTSMIIHDLMQTFKCFGVRW
jgi:hypothetical protein